MVKSSEIRETIISILNATDKPVQIASCQNTGISRNTLSKYLEGMAIGGSVAMIHHGMAKKFYIQSKDSFGKTKDEEHEFILIIDASRSVMIFDKIYQKNTISSLNPERTEEIPIPHELLQCLNQSNSFNGFPD